MVDDDQAQRAALAHALKADAQTRARLARALATILHERRERARLLKKHRSFSR
jgi:hypothetical protein